MARLAAVHATDYDIAHFASTWEGNFLSGRDLGQHQSRHSAPISQVAFRVSPQREAGTGLALARSVAPQINEWFGRGVVWMELWSSNNLTSEEGVEPTTMWLVHSVQRPLGLVRFHLISSRTPTLLPAGGRTLEGHPRICFQ